MIFLITISITIIFSNQIKMDYHLENEVILVIACVGMLLATKTSVIASFENGYGFLKITRNENIGQTFILNGGVIHSSQFTSPQKSNIPTSYFHRDGPVGHFFEALKKDGKIIKNIGIVGLGAGTLAAYGEKGQDITFYDINPDVVKIAQNPKYFTYLRDCPAKINIEIGDAREKLRLEQDGKYDIILFDAYNSDRVPRHLVTKEAIAEYIAKIKQDGVLLLHISSRSDDLEFTIGNNLKALGYAARIEFDLVTHSDEKNSSKWVAVAREERYLGSILDDYRWSLIKYDDSKKLYLDEDYYF